MAININKWNNCYDDSWQEHIVPEAFAHPAKMAYGLLSRILSHAEEQGWLAPESIILDPFGGISTTGILAAYRGYQAITCELEPKFTQLAMRNVKLHKSKWDVLKCPYPVILQGDSRQLSEIIGQADIINNYNLTNTNISATLKGKKESDNDDEKTERSGRFIQKGNVNNADISNIAQMSSNIINNVEAGRGKNKICKKSGKVDKTATGDSVALRDQELEPKTDCRLLQSLTISNTINHEKITNKAQGQRQTGKTAPQLYTRPIKCSLSNVNQKRKVSKLWGTKKSGDSSQKQRPLRQSSDKSGSSLQSLPHELNKEKMVGGEESRVADAQKQRTDKLEKVDVIISSPPYAEMQTLGNSHENGMRGKRPGKYSDQKGKYSNTPGNLGNLKAGKVDVILSSPPFSEDHARQARLKANWCGRGGDGFIKAQGYAKTNGNLGAMKYEKTKSNQTKEDKRQQKKQISLDMGKRCLLSEQQETFWHAAKEIVQECYKILKPGGQPVSDGDNIEFCNCRGK